MFFPCCFWNSLFNFCNFKYDTSWCKSVRVHLVWNPQLPLSFPGGAVVKNLPANAGDARCGFNPWIWKIPWSEK